MIFQVKMTVHVADNDEDVMRQFPDSVLDRFAGTAIHIDAITVEKK